MTIHYQWRIHGCELGGGEAADVEAVTRALTEALTRCYAPDGPEVLAEVLGRFWGPLRDAMGTDGANATAHPGGSWTGAASGITVRIWADR
jgi:hypothetical protein